MCGILGVVNSEKEAASDLYFGLYALQHRGKESAGIVTTNGKTIYSQLGMGEIPMVFKGDALKRLCGSSGIAHNRYSTTSASNIENIQPIRGFWRKEEFWIAHNGNLVNTEILRQECLNRGRTPYASSDTGIIATLISLHCSDSFEEAVKETANKLKGAFSIVILYKGKIIALRDNFGFRPLHFGIRENDFMVSSETCALYHMGATPIREIEPGEMVTIDKTGISAYHRSPSDNRRFCIFEIIYFLRPDSVIFGKRVKNFRKKMGEFLARDHPVKADIVIPIPDSGKYGGIGFIRESGIKNGEETILRTHLTTRTFIEPVQELREKGVDLKFVLFEEDIQGKIVAIVDDSIVRGVTIKKLVQRLRKAGAKEIHARIHSPPYRFPCFFGIDTYRVRDELIAARHQGDVEKIKEEIELASLEYLSVESMINAVIEVSDEYLTKKNFCAACFTGEYPVEPPKEIFNS